VDERLWSRQNDEREADRQDKERKRWAELWIVLGFAVRERGDGK